VADMTGVNLMMMMMAGSARQRKCQAHFSPARHVCRHCQEVGSGRQKASEIAQAGKFTRTTSAMK
jgi:ribosomal protein L40E